MPAKRFLILGAWLLLASAAVSAQGPAPAPTVRTALEAAQKHVAALEAELLKTPEGVRFLAAREIVRQLQELVKVPAQPVEKK